uniref:Uncharacterized protein n=1 Tax=Oryza brachyantha TaxID=4533 RepID=J3L7E1_ORYBR
ITVASLCGLGWGWVCCSQGHRFPAHTLFETGRRYDSIGTGRMVLVIFSSELIQLRLNIIENKTGSG